MLKDVHFPRRVAGDDLDRYLAKGWYRIGQVMFTTDHIPQPLGWYRVFWLRFRLSSLNLGKKQQQVIRANRHFLVTVKNLSITDELEALYASYYASIDFSPSPTLRGSLFDYSPFDDTIHQVFDSWVVEVRDANRLVAAGIFDKGQKAIAGIVNFFDPAYKKYSPGKFLMLQKILYAQTQQLYYYYPGYIAVGYPKFDYKLFPDVKAAEIYDPVQGGWLPYTPSLIASLKDNPPPPPDEDFSE